jgi:serine/threonine protein kinase
MSANRLRRIEELYHAAMTRSGEARQAFLDEACTGDAALREDVLALVTRAPSAADILEGPAGNAAAPPEGMALAAGTRFGPYEILAPIGAGGMGEVYRARDTRLDRTVAVKILPRHLRANPRLLARFAREARAIAALNHPHICTLHDVGSHEGIDFLVMEHIEGETLRSRLGRGPLSIEETVRCGREVADALAAAHRQGLVHRDIKPSNIIVTPNGDAKVVDFGLARLAALISAGQPAKTEPTESGVVVGTPHYMSPEQARGLPLDPRTDIFSLGVVLFECLTGRLPFDGEMRDDYLQHLLAGEPLAIGALRTDVPADLQALIERCLEGEVSRRLESAAELAAELDRIAGGGVAGPPVVPALRRPGVIAAVLIAAVLVAAAFLVLWRLAGPVSPRGTAGDSPPSSISRRFESAYLPGPQVSMPEVHTHMLPRYPVDGAADRFRGVIDVEVLVRADGRVASGRVTRWPSKRAFLVEDTLGILQHWLFRPALKSRGQPVSVLVMVQFAFEPPSKPDEPGSVSALLSPLPRFSGGALELFATAVDGETPGLQPPMPVRMIQPAYASHAGAEKGTTHANLSLVILVLPDGSVGAVRALPKFPGFPGLGEEVVAAAGRWLFEPGMLAGKPVATKLTVPFSLEFQ